MIGKDKRGRSLAYGHDVLWKAKLSNGRVRWKRGTVITVGTKYVHVLTEDERRIRLLPSQVEKL